MDNQFFKVTKDEYDAYIEGIAERLKLEAPEWHVVSQSTPENSAVYQHLARFDFSKGKDQTWDIPISSWVFAYTQRADDQYEYYLLNIHPLEHKG